MKINPISFGQTYLLPSLKYMSPENREKLQTVYALGEIYPVDLFLGSNKKGDLTIEVTQGSLYDYLVLNNEIPLNRKNVDAIKLIKQMERAYRNVHGHNLPVKKATVKYLDYIPADMLPYYVASEVEDYSTENFKKFNN